MKKLKLAVLVSGSGTNLQAIIDACKNKDFPAEISVVISNNPDAYGLERADKAGIPKEIIDHKNYETRQAFDMSLHVTLCRYAPDLICMAGFMRILTPVFVEKWTGKIINTHPSLLPHYGGKGMYGEHVHRAVLAAGEKISGCSIHYVTPGVDEGPVILQKEVPVMNGDTPESLAARILEQEHKLYPEAIRQIAEQT